MTFSCHPWFTVDGHSHGGMSHWELLDVNDSKPRKPTGLHSAVLTSLPRHPGHEPPCCSPFSHPIYSLTLPLPSRARLHPLPTPPVDFVWHTRSSPAPALSSCLTRLAPPRPKPSSESIRPRPPLLTAECRQRTSQKHTD